MPSFDIGSDVDMTEVKNAVLMTRKELQNRFDFKGVTWDIEEKDDMLVISADDEYKLQAVDQTLMGKISKRNISLKNFEHQKTGVSNMGRGRQEIKIKQGLESDVAKQIIKLIKDCGVKVQTQHQDRKVRVTGKSRDDLQKVIQFVKESELPVGVNFDNFRS
ncbi:MAG: YajQ family cyclic di-GMP-binding protein [Candidatus Methylacidiphilales bacterium]